MGTHGEGELCTTMLCEPQTVTKAPEDEVSPIIGEHPLHFATWLMPEAALVPIVPHLLTQKMGMPEGSSASSCLASPLSEGLEALTLCSRYSWWCSGWGVQWHSLVSWTTGKSFPRESWV